MVPKHRGLLINPLVLAYLSCVIQRECLRRLLTTCYADCVAMCSIHSLMNVCSSKSEPCSSKDVLLAPMAFFTASGISSFSCVALSVW